MAKEIAVGIDDFKMIIEGNNAFADKTLFINEFFQSGAHVSLAPRPRRFGKTMNLSMLRYFCEKPYSAKATKGSTEPSNAHLFDGLKVSQYPVTMAHQGQYPVIFLTFKSVKASTWDECYKKLQIIISSEYRRHNYLLHSDLLDKSQKRTFQAIIDRNAGQEDYEHSLENLSEHLYKHHNKRAIILIDEYDTPIHEAVMQKDTSYYTKLILFMRNFLGGGLKGNTSLHKGFITGILQVAKESIFSDMNNLSVYALTAMGADKNLKPGDPGNFLYTDKFGLLETEVVDLFQQAEVPLDLDQIKQWYNGYHSGNFTVYNPWSIINFLAHKEYKPFWINTSENKLPRVLAAKASTEIKAEIEQLRDGGMIRKNINEQISFADIETQENVLWSFLLFSGYLTFRVPEGRTDASDFYLVTPNKEVKDFFKTMVTAWFDAKQLHKILSPLLLSLASGDISAFKAQFEDTVMRFFSYIEVGENEAESFYHAFVLGLISGLDKTHEIRSNRESGTGRYDVMIVPREKKDIGLIIEFKKKHKNDANLEATAVDALEQIEDKKYDVELIDRGITTIKKLAIVFDGKESLVVEA